MYAYMCLGWLEYSDAMLLERTNLYPLQPWGKVMAATLTYRSMKYDGIYIRYLLQRFGTFVPFSAFTQINGTVFCYIRIWADCLLIEAVCTHGVNEQWMWQMLISLHAYSSLPCPLRLILPDVGLSRHRGHSSFYLCISIFTAHN